MHGYAYTTQHAVMNIHHCMSVAHIDTHYYAHIAHMFTDIHTFMHTLHTYIDMLVIIHRS